MNIHNVIVIVTIYGYMKPSTRSRWHALQMQYASAGKCGTRPQNRWSWHQFLMSRCRFLWPLGSLWIETWGNIANCKLLHPVVAWWPVLLGTVHQHHAWSGHTCHLSLSFMCVCVCARSGQDFTRWSICGARQEQYHQYPYLLISVDIWWDLLISIDIYWCLLISIDIYWCLLIPMNQSIRDDDNFEAEVISFWSPTPPKLSAVQRILEETWWRMPSRCSRHAHARTIHSELHVEFGIKQVAKGDLRTCNWKIS